MKTLAPHRARSLVLSALLSALALIPLQQATAVNAAFVHIRKSDASTTTRMHISEVEAFADSEAPNELGGATFGGLATSTNDIGDGTLTTAGVGNTWPTIGTTNTIQHGATNANPDNLLQNGGAVWSTNPGQPTVPQYTLNLGGTHDVTTVRIWPRADGCCQERFRNLEVQLLDAAMNPIPGTLMLGPTTDSNAPLEFSFNPFSAAIDDTSLEAVVTFPTENDPVVISSATNGTVVGTLTALNDSGLKIESATFTLVAGAGDTDNGSYAIGGPDGDQLLVDASLSGLDDAVHSVRVQVDAGAGAIEAVFNFTVKLDSEPDGLIDDWETTFGLLSEFMTGGDADSDGLDDEEEFDLGTNPKEEDSDDDGSNDGDEIDNMTDPLDKDSDDDGLEDGPEATAGSDPLVQDTDGDGLLDGFEVAVDPGMGNPFMTDPTKRDTDGDGFDDDVELALGSNPTSNSSRPNLPNAQGRFIEVVKNDLADTRLHIAEFEVFAPGVDPDGTGGGNAGLSSNDLIDIKPLSPMPYLGPGTPTTTTTLEHGNNENLVNNMVESGGAVWSTASGQAVNARYVLDLGETVLLDKVRIWARGDTCCQQRFENMTINLYADDGAGNPGDIVATVEFPERAPAGSAGPLEISFGAVAVVPTPLEIRQITYNQAAQEFTLEWTSRPDHSYGIYYSRDLIDWGADIDDSLPPSPDMDTTTHTFPHPALPGDPAEWGELFFRVEESPIVPPP